MGKIHSVPIPDVLYKWINLCVFLITAIKCALNISCFVWVPRIKMREQQVQGQTNKNPTKRHISTPWPKESNLKKAWEMPIWMLLTLLSFTVFLTNRKSRNDIVKTWLIVTSDAPSGPQVTKSVSVKLLGEHLMRAKTLYFRWKVNIRAVPSANYMRKRCAFDVRLTTGNHLIYKLNMKTLCFRREANDCH